MQEIPKIKNYLTEATRRANEFKDRDENELSEYWEGQVMGMVKVIKVLQLDINTEFYLKMLP